MLLRRSLKYLILFKGKGHIEVEPRICLRSLSIGDIMSRAADEVVTLVIYCHNYGILGPMMSRDSSLDAFIHNFTQQFIINMKISIFFLILMVGIVYEISRQVMSMGVTNASQ